MPPRRVPEVTDDPTPVASKPAADAPQAPTKPVEAATSVEAEADTRSDSVELDLALLMGHGDWRYVLAELEGLNGEHDSPALYALLRAKALAHLGRQSEALDWATESLTLDPLDIRAQLFHALLSNELNQPERAIKGLRKAIFLDQSFAEAHFHLGLILMAQGKGQAGLKNLENALSLALSLEADTALLETPGMTMGELAETLRREISSYSGV